LVLLRGELRRRRRALGAVARSGQAVLIADCAEGPRVIIHADPSLAVRSLIVAPIMFRRNLLGVLAVANPADGLAFSEADFSLVQSPRGASRPRPAQRRADAHSD